MTAPTEQPAATLEGLIDLCAAGAGWAATALEQLVGRSVASGPPVLCEGGESEEHGPWRTALFFETEGALPGLVILLLSPASRDLLLRTLLGGDGAPDPGTRASALRELGNIVASQTVSAMANRLGATVLLSVPRLVDGDVEVDLAGVLAHRGSRGRLESLLTDARGALKGLLVIAPDALAETGG